MGAGDPRGAVAGVLAGATGDAGAAPAVLAALPGDPRGVRCDSSVRVAAAAGDTATRFAVWWSVRPDSSAWLVAARSRDGGRTWAGPVPVDTLDRGGRGCARPSPSAAYDPTGGYVHVVYFLDAPEGDGLFFAHSMDAGATFHAPVAIVYGERPSRATVAASRDTVAVAYEDPNTRQPQIALALSRTAGHIFESKSLPVSGGALPAEAPVVGVRGGRVVVAWRELQGERATVVRRAGTLQ